jgi:hypothetical protein
MSLSYSRSLQPSGYGDLVTQDTLTLTRHFSWTERWSGAASLRGTRQLGSLGRLAFGDRKYLAADIAARWLWTRQWAISLEAVYNQQKLDQQLPQASSTTVLLTLTGQIGRRTIQ